jgi:hypothetical protein
MPTRFCAFLAVALLFSVRGMAQAPAAETEAGNAANEQQPTQNQEAGPQTPKDCKCHDAKDCYQLLPCYCLQQLWMDYPGPFDLYICRLYSESCDEEPTDELWFGMPKNSLRPQVCLDEEEQCESEGYGERNKGIEGHGSTLTDESAWGMARAALQAAKKKVHQLTWGQPEFHEIPRRKIPEGLEITSNVLVMAVPINGKRPTTDTYYLCIQIDSLESEDLTEAEFEDGVDGSGRQFSIKYHVDGEDRTGLVWLK